MAPPPRTIVRPQRSCRSTRRSTRAAATTPAPDGRVDRRCGATANRSGGPPSTLREPSRGRTPNLPAARCRTYSNACSATIASSDAPTKVGRSCSTPLQRMARTPLSTRPRGRDAEGVTTLVTTSNASVTSNPSTNRHDLDGLDARGSIYTGRSRLRALWTEWSVEVRVLSGAVGKPRKAGPRIGDRVTIQDQTGVVEDVRLNYTVLRTAEGRRLRRSPMIALRRR